ncbi:hypothetical protein ACFLYT_01795, partial [Nanoarchaeota archaeon]
MKKILILMVVLVLIIGCAKKPVEKEEVDIPKVVVEEVKPLSEMTPEEIRESDVIVKESEEILGKALDTEDQSFCDELEAEGLKSLCLE